MAHGFNFRVRKYFTTEVENDGKIWQKIKLESAPLADLFGSIDT
jgi:hypothetical protein